MNRTSFIDMDRNRQLDKIRGSLVGGAVVGYDAIPEFFKTDLELHDVILHVVDDLWRGRTTKFK